MKNTAAASHTTFPPFQKGQMWRVGDLNYLITSVGKMLVYYKQQQPRGKQVTLSSKTDLQNYLVNSKAVLIPG